jgi:hypothetical protein
MKKFSNSSDISIFLDNNSSMDDGNSELEVAGQIIAHPNQPTIFNSDQKSAGFKGEPGC